MGAFTDEDKEWISHNLVENFVLYPFVFDRERSLDCIKRTEQFSAWASSFVDLDGFVHELIMGKYVVSELEYYGTFKAQNQFINFLDSYLKHKRMYDYRIKIFKEVKIDDFNIFRPCIAVYKVNESMPVFIIEIVLTKHDRITNSLSKEVVYANSGVQELWVVDIAERYTLIYDHVKEANSGMRSISTVIKSSTLGFSVNLRELFNLEDWA